jgi:16S rRNA (cytosine1402-N4)-methyltransferase
MRLVGILETVIYVYDSTHMLTCTDKDNILKRTIVGLSAHDERVTLSQLKIGQQTVAATPEAQRQVFGRPDISTSSATDEYMTRVNEPATNAIHVPVMSAEVIEGLSVTAGGAFIDCNLGEGGHAEAILHAAEEVSLLGIDLDQTAIDFARNRLADFADRLELVQSNFSEISEIAGGRQFEGVLFDLGVSSLQLDTPDRGFSFRYEAPLDMRFNPQTGLTAYDIVNRYPEHELETIIRDYGEEPRARSIARAIAQRQDIHTTTELADIVKHAANWSSRSRVHPATRTFQALRIAVNGELDNLEKGLMGAIEALRPNGRLVVLSYHSLEDRVVKTVMRREASKCICPPGPPVCVCQHVPTLSLINRRVIVPSKDEVRSNPRARSAKMRITQRL